MLMPYRFAMKFRMSRRLALFIRTFVGSREAGFSTGSADAARARSRICWIGGFGRDASIRALIVRSSSATLDVARRLLGSYSLACLYSPCAASSWSFCSNSWAFSMWARDAASSARCSAIL